MYYRIETEFTGELKPKTENPLPLPSDWTALLTHARIFNDVRARLRLFGAMSGTYAPQSSQITEGEFIVSGIALPAIADGEKLTVAVSPGQASRLQAVGFHVRSDRHLVAYFDDAVQLSTQTWTRLLFYPPDHRNSYCAEQIEKIRAWRLA